MTNELRDPVGVEAVASVQALLLSPQTTSIRDRAASDVAYLARRLDVQNLHVDAIRAEAVWLLAEARWCAEKEYDLDELPWGQP